MKHIKVTKHEDRFHIEGYPDAVALKQIDDPDARELQSLILHHSDIEFCSAVIGSLAETPTSNNAVVTQALWIACISRYFKCFGTSKSRTSLSAKELFEVHVGSKAVFDYFKSLRDKHIIHDENAYSQAFTAVVVNSGTAQVKIGDVIASAINALTNDDAHVTQFKQLIEVAEKWVIERQSVLYELLAKRYEQWSYEDLIALPDIRYTVPDGSSIRQRR